MSTGDRPKDPFRGFKFRVEIEGITKFGFREVSGLDCANDSVDYREGIDGNIRKLAGLPKFSNLTFKRGMTDDMNIWTWRQSIIDGKIQSNRKNGHIFILDDEGKDAAEFTFVNAWPVKWTGPTFNATANEVAIDTMELAHEGLTRVK